jgi:hypothetical protein
VNLLRIFDVPRLQADLATVDRDWLSHGPGHDGWDVIPLRSRGGRTDEVQPSSYGEPCKDTAVLKQCPYFQEVIQALHPVSSVRLSALAPGGQVKPHRDTEHARKVHVVIETNPEALMQFQTGAVHWAAGEAWEADFSTKHSAVNKGLTRRVHLLLVRV